MRYWVAMAALGVGSIFFCAALLRSTLLPRLLAIWGFVGAVFALGSVLELAGYGVGLALSVPGGLFEVAAGSFLVVKGFRHDAAARRRYAQWERCHRRLDRLRRQHLRRRPRSASAIAASISGSLSM